MEIKYSNKTGFIIDSGKLNNGKLNNNFVQAEDLSRALARIAANERKIKILERKNWRKHGRTR